MLKDGKLYSKVFKCTRAVRGDLKGEFFIKNQVLLFGFCLIFLQDFVFVCKLDSNKKTYEKKREIAVKFKIERGNIPINKLVDSRINNLMRLIIKLTFDRNKGDH